MLGPAARFALTVSLMLACKVAEPSQPPPDESGASSPPVAGATSDEASAAPQESPPVSETEAAEAPEPAIVWKPGEPSAPRGLGPERPQIQGPVAEKFSRVEVARARGDFDGARDAAVLIVRDHPTSPFLPLTFYLLADSYYVEGKFTEARQMFEKALFYKGDDVHAHAHYWIGWCKANGGDYVGALDSFIEAARQAGTMRTDSGRALFRASLFDSVDPFIRVRRIDEAAEFYRKLVSGTDVKVEQVLEVVAEVARQNGRKDELARVCAASGSPGWCTSGTGPAR